MKRALLVIALLAIAPVLLSAANGADLKVRVAVQTANIRSGPEMTASVVQTAKVGSVFPVIRKSGDWYLIQLETGGQAYIHATVVEEVTEPEAAPVKPAEKPPAKPAAPPVKAPETPPAAAPATIQRPAQRPAVSSNAAAPKLYVRLNYGYGPQKESKSLSFERTQYQETAAFGMNYAMKAASMIFDGAVGYMLTPSLGVELGASMTSNRDITETLDASIPHPLWMSYPREGTIDGPDLKLNQIDLYLNAVYSFRFSKLGVSLFAGPCYLMSTATIVTDVATEEKGYPYMNLDVIQTASEIKSNAFGFDAGAAVSFSFGRMFDVFLDARYIMGKGAFKPEGDLPELELNLGGFRAGGGLKLRF